ncbi:MAG: FtsX-like permease family protein [Chloroflexota bacterium]|nr:FtsX-like permease family protein [Chloroflexota bacterium]
MNEIFGVSVTGIMVVLLILLALCLLSVAWVAWRRPVIFKLGVRNIPRRKAQTTLVVIGLMLSTMIIAAALGTGDTIDHSATASIFDSLGHVDELVVSSPDEEVNVGSALTARFDQAVADRIETAFADDPIVDGVMPILIETVPAILGTPEQPRQAEPQARLIGVDPARLDDFGGLRDVGGGAIDLATLAPDAVVLSETMAEDLAAVVGDIVTVFYANKPIQFTVAAVAEDGPLSGRFDQSTPGMVLPLQRLQETTNQPARVTMIGISNRGGVEDGLDFKDEVVTKLQPLLAGQGLGVDPIKANAIEEAETFAQVFTGIFLILGLFSIAVGILLIVLIFTMLAAERRSEMGMARAVGAHRRQLIQQFVAEGSGYALLAGLVGAALGVVTTIAIGLAIGALFGRDLFQIEPSVSPRSLVVAYCLGVVITFLAVVGSSWKISRLNVVAAVRNIPDVPRSPRRRLRTLIWAVVLMGLGGLLTWAGQRGDTARAFTFYGGMSLLPFSVTLLRYLGAPSRPVFSLVGLYLLVLWLLPSDVATDLFGDLGGDFEMFFLSGIFMVAGASILIVQNLDLLLAGMSRLGGLFRGALPAVRTAISYPGAAKGRTGMTIAMFSLIVFSLVTFATINQNFVKLFLGDEANAGWDVRADALAANPIGDVAAFETQLQSRGVDTGQFEATGRVVTGTDESRLRVVGDPDQEWKSYQIRGMDQGFIDESRLLFQARAEGYADDAALIEALRTRDDVAIVDAFAVPAEGGFGGDEAAFTLTGYKAGQEIFPPIQVEVERPSGEPATLTVIGILDDEIGSLFGLFAREQAVVGPIGIYPDVASASYFVRVADPDQADAIAKQVETALLTNGVQAVSILDELEEAQQQSTAFLYIIQGFMALGLIVGIAAVGVIAFRNVVERRQQIGMLRALGYQRSLVSLSFMIETTFVVGMGVLSGTILGLALARNLFTSDDFGGPDAGFVVPWEIVTAILLVTIAAALLMTWIPARQASRVTPAEALRYEWAATDESGLVVLLPCLRSRDDHGLRRLSHAPTKPDWSPSDEPAYARRQVVSRSACAPFSPAGPISQAEPGSDRIPAPALALPLPLGCLLRRLEPLRRADRGHAEVGHRLTRYGTVPMPPTPAASLSTPSSPSSDRVPVAGAAARPAALGDRLVVLPALAPRWDLGGHHHRAAGTGPRHRGPAANAECRNARQPIGQDDGKGGPRGDDAGKQVTGRKRHLLVDPTGLLLAAHVHPADLTDREGAKSLLAPLRDRFPRLAKLWADAAYQAPCAAWITHTLGWEVEIVRQPPKWVWWPVDQEPPPRPTGFQVRPRRWVVGGPSPGSAGTAA